MTAAAVFDRLKVAASPRDRRRGLILGPGLVLPCALGRSGIRAAKHEGDGATPASILRPVGLLWRPDRLPRPLSPLPVAAIRPADGWCDDSASADYNRPVQLPFAASHERMWRDDGLYDLVVILDWNMAPATPGRGSAIFLHLARPGFLPTEGCIAIRPADLGRLIPRLGPETEIVTG